MFPILMEFGSFRLHSFGVFVSLGFVAGMLWCFFEARRLKLPSGRVVDLSFLLVIAGILGARLLYAALHWRSFAAVFESERGQGALAAGLSTIYQVLAFWNGGVVWYGGLLLGVAAGLFLIRKFDLPLWPTADLVAPGVMLGLAIGRLGCLAAGDDYGQVVESARATVLAGGEAPWWTMTFRDPASLVPDALLGLPLYPTQVMMSLNALAIFGVLVAMRSAKAFHGQVLWSMLALYALGRIAIEFFRGDSGRGFLLDGAMSTSQFLSAVLIVMSSVMLVYCARTQRARLHDAPANV